MRIPPLFLSILFFSFSYENVRAAVVHWPELCASGSLQIKNSGTAAESVWLQKFSSQLLSETEHQIEPGAEVTIAVDRLESEHYSLLNFAPGTLAVHYQCGKISYEASTLEGGQLSFQRNDSGQIWLQNLYTGENSVQIEFQNSAFQTLETTTLKLSAFASQLYSFPERVKLWSYFRITSSNRMSSFSLTAKGLAKPILIKPQQSKVDSTAAYFMVAARTGASDSFVVKIKDQKLAGIARDLIKNPQKEKMLFAKIQKDHQGFNRNWSTQQKSFWSWSTSEVTNFADLGSTACNGQPQQVEDRIDGWLDDPGQICFWNYRVKKELKPLEVATGALLTDR